MVIDETSIEALDDDHYDDHVEEEIRSCFSRENPKCFFVSAGAGSGNTRCLIITMTYIEEKMGKWFRENGK